MAPLTLEDRFTELRDAVEAEIARARRELIAELSRAAAQMRSASNESEWNSAVMESGRNLAAEPAALELLGTLAALTAPAAAHSSPGGKRAAAQRFARVKIAEIQLYHAPKVKAGRAARDLYGFLKPHIDAARQAFRERFLIPGHERADDLHTELLRALANDDVALLGPGYPGPLA